MTLKEISHALAYGKSITSLKRSEDARRVKLAMKMNLRRRQGKLLTFCERYGSSFDIS